jgi:hypothetical protein
MQSKPKTFPTPHIGHSRHVLFFKRWIVNPMFNLLKRTMAYLGFEPGTFGLAGSIANHYTIELVRLKLLRYGVYPDLYLF